MTKVQFNNNLIRFPNANNGRIVLRREAIIGYTIQEVGEHQPKIYLNLHTGDGHWILFNDLASIRTRELVEEMTEKLDKWLNGAPV